MSFLKIVDVITNSNGNRLGGPSSLGGKQYERNTFRFPEDIGSYDKGHYILFNINEQKNTQFPGTKTSDEPTIVQNMRDLQSRRGETNAGVVGPAAAAIGKYISQAATQLGSVIPTNTLNNITNISQEVRTNATNFFGADAVNLATNAASIAGRNITGITPQNFLRTIQRTTDTIALYMPDTLSFVNSQTYKQVQLGGSVLSAQGAISAATSLYNSITTGDTNGAPAATFVTQALAEKSGSQTLKALSTAATGVVNNPMLEVIYSQPSFREFNFSFMFYPRSEKEALTVQKILERFRFHQAPEIMKNTGGFFLIPPSEFDISFMYNGSVNPNIDRISTCVLRNISVNYAPKGFHAYEVGGENDPKLGRTGMPVGIGLTLSFMETQIITKEYYTKDSYNSIDDYLNRSGYYDPYNQKSVNSDSPPI